MQWESSSEGAVVTRVAQTDMGDFVVVEAGKHIHLLVQSASRQRSAADDGTVNNQHQRAMHAG